MIAPAIAVDIPEMSSTQISTSGRNPLSAIRRRATPEIFNHGEAELSGGR